MGRQLPIVTRWPDEVELLQFLQQHSSIRVFHSFTPTPEQVWIDDWQQRPIVDDTYHIWPTTFPWQPEFLQTIKAKKAADRSKWYISNYSNAPVIEFSRNLYGGMNACGRLYWSKYFSAAMPLEYDVAAFDRLIDSLWRWVRKHGRRHETNLHHPYILPHAAADEQ